MKENNSVTIASKGDIFLFKDRGVNRWVKCKLVETCDDRDHMYRGWGLIEYLNADSYEGHDARNYAPGTNRRFLWITDEFFTSPHREVKFLHEPIGIDDLI